MSPTWYARPTVQVPPGAGEVGGVGVGVAVRVGVGVGVGVAVRVGEGVGLPPPPIWRSTQE